MAKKASVVTRFSHPQLEELLTSSTKNVAHEVVSCMIPQGEESGLLLTLEKEVRETGAKKHHNLELRPKSPMQVKPVSHTVSHAHLKTRSRDLRGNRNLEYQDWNHQTTTRHEKEILSS